ncbi:MAG: hypothetical protein Q8M07_25470 [Prosthecobacter sp.]|nr:hypothetical protein [Prosthecobacter sp.]
MKTHITALALALVASSILHAQEAAKPSSILPANFLGKTFEECEKILGQPVKIENPEGKWRSFARYYKSPAPGLSRIKLERVPEGSMAGPVPATVNSVWLYFPKGQIKSFADALTKSGLSTQGLADANLQVPLQELGSSTLDGIQGGLRAMWGLAEASKKMPPQYQHHDEDTLWVTKKRRPGDGERKGVVKAGELKFDLSVASDGRSFLGRNNESEAITEVQMTVYPHPSKPGEISPADESFSNVTIKQIEPNGRFQNPPQAFTDANHVRLPDCSGMVKITAKVAGVSKSVTIDLMKKDDKKSN